MSITTDLPAWAYLTKDTKMIRGSDLLPGDTVRFGPSSYPRVLWTKLDDTTWSVTISKPYGHVKDRMKIDPRRYYVVQRTPAEAVVTTIVETATCVGCENELTESDLCEQCGRCHRSCCKCEVADEESDESPDPYFLADMNEDDWKGDWHGRT